jgi:hypothetical protein
LKNRVLRRIMGHNGNKTMRQKMAHSLMIYAAKYYWDDQIKEGEMGRICSKYGEERIAYKTLAKIS